MLDAPAIASALSGLVGWRPAAESNPAGPLHLSAPLLKSASGLFVQDVSELLTLDVLQHAQPRTETLSGWLTRLQSDAITRFVSALTAAQGLDGKVLLPSTPLTKAPGNRANTVNKLSRFVGIQLDFARKAGVSYSLPSLSLQLDGALTEPLPLYLYTDTQPEPLQVLQLGPGNKPYFPYALDLAPEPAPTTTNLLPAPLPIVFYDAGASDDTPPLLGSPSIAIPTTAKVWLGYYEDDLPLGVRAIEAPVGPCGCPDDPFVTRRPYVAAVPFSVPAVALNDARDLFDPAAVSLETGNYGLNLRFFGYCNVATTLQTADNQLRLAPLVQMALAIRMLEAVISTPNVTQLTGRQDVQADAQFVLYTLQAKLYGGKVPGTDAVYPSALKNLTLDLTGLDAACGPAKYSPLSMGSLTTR